MPLHIVTKDDVPSAELILPLADTVADALLEADSVGELLGPDYKCDNCGGRNCCKGI